MDISPISLTELQNIIQSTVHRELSQHFWVTAEIAEIKINYSGHCYLELTDKDKKSDTIHSRLRGVIWARQARFILPYFKTTTGMDLSHGMSVLIKGKAEYHALYGLSLVINDIDPKFTIGDLAKKRKDILNRLQIEGVLEMNGELSLPMHPGRIAVISSDDAAGYGDFKDHLSGNSYGYYYKTDLYRAAMQGTTTSSSVVDAFNKISEKIDLYDLVVVVRGGGSSTDLSWFDDYDIAFMVSQFPIPVVTGIGHDKDLSVTDIVAHTNCKTPTAVADFIIDLTADTEEYILSMGRRVVSDSLSSLQTVQKMLDSIRVAIVSGSRIRIGREKQSLVLRKEIIISNSNHLITLKRSESGQCSTRIKIESVKYIPLLKEKIDNIKRSIEYLSPTNVLKRGYSITLKSGKSIKKSENLNPGDRITTILYDGKIESEVFDIKE